MRPSSRVTYITSAAIMAVKKDSFVVHDGTGILIIVKTFVCSFLHQLTFDASSRVSKKGVLAICFIDLVVNLVAILVVLSMMLSIFIFIPSVKGTRFVSMYR
jgi:hypothetical protein